MWTDIIQALAAIAVAVIGAMAARERKAARIERGHVDNRAAQRAEESRLSMNMMLANCKLGVVTAKAVTHQHVNGDVEEAMTAAKKACEEYDIFVKALASRQLSKK